MHAAPANGIIDMHCHTAGIGAGNSGCFISPAMRKSWRYRVFLKAFWVTEEQLLQEGDALVMRRISERLAASQRVTAAVILAMDGAVNGNGELDRNGTEMYIPNEFVAAETAKYANLLFGASVNPMRHDALARLEKAAADGAVLVKWLPSIQHFDPADEHLVPFYLKLKELGLPLLTHTGTEHSFTMTRNELGDPERLRLPLSLGVKVIAAHCGSCGRNEGESNYRRFLRLLDEFPNCYGDISALTQINRKWHLARLLKKGVTGQLLYGTDMPLPNTISVTPYAFPIKLSPRRMVELSRIANPWDQDVALKEALGVPEQVFSNANAVLRLSSPTP